MYTILNKEYLNSDLNEVYNIVKRRNTKMQSHMYNKNMALKC